MSENKTNFCCGDAENLFQGFSCSFEATEKGFRISVTSDDPEKVEKLKAKMQCCCDSTDSKSCC